MDIYEPGGTPMDYEPDSHRRHEDGLTVGRIVFHPNAKPEPDSTAFSKFTVEMKAATLTTLTEIADKNKELRAQVESQQIAINELVRALSAATAEMWGNVDADEVIIHTSDGKAAHVTPKTAKAYRAAMELIAKYGGGK